MTYFTQIWKLDLESWYAQKLVDENRVIRSFSVSPDESRIAMLTTPDGELITNEGWSRVDVFNTNTKEATVVTQDGWRKDHPSPFGWLADLAWSADSAALAFTIAYDGFPPELFMSAIASQLWFIGPASVAPWLSVRR